ncbi:caspase family protein [Telluria beijingensis]|uniref:caspase family protein n=1 Tax=Telluria beijingensis TaxID=3068633 RepID=UPI0027955A7A|nr:caspase family protein [Massilia sp. REN29]
MMTSREWLLLALLAFLGMTHACAEPGSRAARVLDAESKIALVIGNARYVEAAPLKNSGNDATDMCAALKKLGFEVICKLDVASKREFKDAVFEFTGKINQRTVALFYYAGHGLQVDGINYLIPVNAQARTKTDIEDESIQINYLMSELETRQAALNIFFIDACRDNPFSNPIRGYVPMMGLASQLYAPRNSIITMSTGAGQTSFDGEGRNGTFTKNLLQHLPVPRQSIEEMLKAVGSGTRADASRVRLQQDPQITSSFTEKFCFGGCATAQPAPDDGLLAAKKAELDRLQATIAQTRAKQAELDAQQAQLLAKRQELDKLRQGLDNVASQQEELQRRQAEVSQREREVVRLDNELKASTEKFKELEAVRLGLQRKQEEVEQMRKSLALQQAKVEATNQELATRAIKPPEKKAPPISVVPAF